MSFLKRTGPAAMLVCLALASVAWTPWGAVYESAMDERSVADQAADKAIVVDVKAKMADRDAKKALKVKVYCFLRHVFLVGAIDDTAFRSFAVKTAEAEEDVREVTKYFVKETDTTGEDLKVAAKVRAQLIGDSELSSTQIETEVFNGEVVMLGMVAGSKDITIAKRVAAEVTGVRKVTSFLIPMKK